MPDRRKAGTKLKKSTWFEEVKKDLLNKEVDRNKLEKLALDREVWRDIVLRFNEL